MKSVAYWRRWQRGPGSIYWVFACAFSALVLLGGWTAIAGLLRWQWQETLQAEMRQNTNTALALKEHTLRILDTVDQAMLRLGRGVEAAGFDSREVVRIANETGMVPHILTQLSFVGSDGRFVGSNLDPDGTRSQHVSLMERDHIRVHLAPGVSSQPPPGMLHDGLFISQALRGKVSGVWAIQMSRKVVSADGRTLGVVVASLNQSHFTDVYRGVELGSQGGVVLAGLDGVVRVRVIGGASTPTDMWLPESLVRILRTQDHGATLSASSDRLERVIGYSRIGAYPLAVLSGTSLEEAFASWRATRNIVLLLSALLTVAVVAFVSVFLGSVQRLARSHAALQRSEAHAQRANQAKSEFLAAMSHELRTPLTSIRGFAELMELRSSEARVREQSGLIRQAAEHLNALLTEILDLAKIEAGAMPIHMEPVALKPLLREVTELFRVSAVSKGLALHMSVAAQVPATLETDRLKLKQMINNLLSNAIKFTAEGSISLEAELAPDARHVRIHVRDTGAGIPVEQQARIFEKFSQGNAQISYEHGGTGLGLSLSRALAELVGGQLTLESQVGKGSTFTITLPLPSAA